MGLRQQGWGVGVGEETDEEGTCDQEEEMVKTTCGEL